MRKWSSALFIVALTAAAGLYTVVSGNRPLLGLDLQGGVSVVLQPTGPAEEEALDQTVEIIRARVDSLGVAEPEISRQGNTIVVDLPGVQEQQRALELVGQTAELRFRPVLFDLGPDLSTLGIGGTSTTDDSAPDDGADETTSTTAGDEESLGIGVSGGRLSPLAVAQDATTTTGGDDDAPAATGADDDAPAATVADDDAPAATVAGLDPAQQAIVDACSIAGVTPPEDDVADRPVVLADENGNRVCLGPTLLTGNALETAHVSLGPTNQWTVNPVFEPGPEGIDAFNAAAISCWVQNPDPVICPSGRLAIVLDHRVVSSPTINAATFNRDQITISGTFDEDGARDLASVLRFGALPVELETQQTRTVSATLGEDVLRAGITAGLLGLSLVAIYLLAYYRLAGLVAIVGLLISGVLLWAIIAWFGETRGLALTLAGVVGLIVSVGVSADSNIVYFENVKDAYRNGRRVTTAVERAYRSAISTIVKADVVSLIAAALLYLLTVGAVRGFAFYLGLATLLDLLIAWLFMRPALAFLAQRQVVQNRPGLLGLPPTGGES